MSSAFSSSVVVECERGLALVEMRFELRDDIELGLGLFVAAARGLGVLVLPLLDGVEIGQHQFGRDDFHVAHRIDRAGDVMDIVVLKTADRPGWTASTSRICA